MSDFFNEREQSKLKMNRLRGWIIYLLYATRPRPLEFSTLKHLLDARNLPLSSRRLAEELHFLYSEELIRVFPLNAKKPVSDGEQEKILLRYMESSTNMDDDYCAALRTRGGNFQEGDVECLGITRIE